MRNRLHPLLILLSLALTLPAQAKGMELVLGQPALRTQAVSEFLRTVENTLPAAIRDAIEGQVIIRFTKLGTSNEIPASICGGASQEEIRTAGKTILGRARIAHVTKDVPYVGDEGLLPQPEEELIPTVELDTLLLPIIEKGPAKSQAYECGHKTYYRLAVATLVHELTHLFDRSKGWVSKKKTYRNLVSWHKGFIFKESKNQLSARSPDPYEFKSLAENFAVNVEYFLMDPEYPCRRPEYYEFLARVLKHRPASQCALNPTVRLSQTQAPVKIDPARVYQVHYLLADSGKDMSSRWGHAMLRVITCSPRRAEVGPDCLKDVSHHVVVSFRANVTDTKISTIDGLFGNYASQIFLFSMPEVILEYAVGESRDLVSLPLKLTQSELHSFVVRLLQFYWDYQGKYYFFGNNCATEAQDMLKGLLGARALKDISPWISTPKGLYDDLKKRKFIDERLLKEPNARGLYFFPSFLKQAENAFKIIQAKSGLQMTLEDFVNTFSPEDRRALYLDIKPQAKAEDRLAAQFLYMEKLIQDKLAAALQSRAAKWLDQLEQAGKTDSLTKDLQVILKTRQEFNPWRLAKRGYGIPLAEEMADESVIKAKMKEMLDATLRIYQQTKQSAGQDLTAEMSGAAENTKFFLSEIAGEVKPLL